MAKMTSERAVGGSDIRARRRRYQAAMYERELLNCGRGIENVENAILVLEASLDERRELLAVLRDEARGWQEAIKMLETEALDDMDEPEPDAS